MDGRTTDRDAGVSWYHPTTRTSPPERSRWFSPDTGSDSRRSPYSLCEISTLATLHPSLRSVPFPSSYGQRTQPPSYLKVTTCITLVPSASKSLVQSERVRGLEFESGHIDFQDTTVRPAKGVPSVLSRLRPGRRPGPLTRRVVVGVPQGTPHRTRPRHPREPVPAQTECPSTGVPCPTSPHKHQDDGNRPASVGTAEGARTRGPG